MIFHKTTPVTEVVLHCAATPVGWMEEASTHDKVAEIERWHKAKGWKGIGYHWIIDRDGAVAPGRFETTVGAHVKGHNTGTIGVCLIGGHGASADDKFLDHFTPEQRRATWALLREIAGRTDLKKVTGHNQYANKGCPGFRVAKEFPWPPSKKRSILDILIDFLTNLLRSKG